MDPLPATLDHRAELDQVARVVGGSVEDLALRADVDDIDAWFDRQAATILRSIEAGYDQTAAAAGRYLNGLGDRAGVDLDAVTVKANRERLRESIRVAGPVSFKKSMRQHGEPAAARRTMATTLRGAAERLSLGGSRETLMATTAERSIIIGYRRIARPGACDFCTMLARRGAVYKTSSAAGEVVGDRRGRPRGNQRVGRSYHDSCRCVTEPILAAGDGPPGMTRAEQLARAEARADRLRRRERIEQTRAAALAEREAARLGVEADQLLRGKAPDPEVLARYGINAQQYVNARALLKTIKADIRAAAQRQADEVGQYLANADLTALTRPDRLERTRDLVTGAARSRRTQSGYDWMEQLDDAELRRVRERMVDGDLYTPDLVADQVRRVTNLDLTDDEAMEWLTERWLHEDALRSLASGRVPRYADVDALLDIDDYQLSRLFGVADEDAIGHIAQTQATEAARIAERVLGRPTRGPAPWEMDAADYIRELEEVEGILGSVTAGADPGPGYRWAEARLRELVPHDLDTGQHPAQLLDEIRILAQQAGWVS